MSSLGTWRFRLSRLIGRGITRTAAVLTAGRMPPFVSTSALIVQDDRILAVMDPITGQPLLPGGHLRWRETPIHALMREVREETGYDVEPEYILQVVAGEEWAGELGIVRVIYRARITGGALASSSEGEACWLSASDIAASSGRDAPVVQAWMAEGTQPVRARR